MPFRHVVMFQWVDGLGDDHVAGVAAGLSALPALIPEIKAYRHGPDAGVSEGNFDYVLVADFDSADDWRVYRDHPDHQRFIADHIQGKLAARAAAQYEL